MGLTSASSGSDSAAPPREDVTAIRADDSEAQLAAAMEQMRMQLSDLKAAHEQTLEMNLKLQQEQQHWQQQHWGFAQRAAAEKAAELMAAAEKAAADRAAAGQAAEQRAERAARNAAEKVLLAASSLHDAAEHADLHAPMRQDDPANTNVPNDASPLPTEAQPDAATAPPPQPSSPPPAGATFEHHPHESKQPAPPHPRSTLPTPPSQPPAPPVYGGLLGCLQACLIGSPAARYADRFADRYAVPHGTTPQHHHYYHDGSYHAPLSSPDHHHHYRPPIPTDYTRFHEYLTAEQAVEPAVPPHRRTPLVGSPIGRDAFGEDLTHSRRSFSPHGYPRGTTPSPRPHPRTSRSPHIDHAEFSVLRQPSRSPHVDHAEFSDLGHSPFAAAAAASTAAAAAHQSSRTFRWQPAQPPAPPTFSMAQRASTPNSNGRIYAGGGGGGGGGGGEDDDDDDDFTFEKAREWMESNFEAAELVLRKKFDEEQTRINQIHLDEARIRGLKAGFGAAHSRHSSEKPRHSPELRGPYGSTSRVAWAG